MRAGKLAVNNLHRTAVRLHEFAHHGKTDARSLQRAAVGRRPGVEGLEHLLPLARRDAGTGVSEIDDGRRAVRIGMQVDGAAAWREFQGIGQQVVEHQLELRAVADQARVRDLQVECQVARGERQPLAVDHRADQRAQPELGPLDGARLRLPGAVGQQVLDESLETQRILPEDRGDFALVVVERADRAVQQQVGSLADIGQRSLQFVRHVPQEAIPLHRDLEQPRAQPLELASQGGEIGRTLAR